MDKDKAGEGNAGDTEGGDQGAGGEEPETGRVVAPLVREEEGAPNLSPPPSYKAVIYSDNRGHNRL